MVELYVLTNLKGIDQLTYLDFTLDVVEHGFDTSPAHATTRDSFIPLFSGQPADYKEWRKRIHVYYRKMGSTKRHGEAVLKISSAVFKVRLGDLWKPSTLMTARKPLPLTPSSSSWIFEYDTRVQLASDFDGYFGLQRKLERPCGAAQEAGEAWC